KESPLQGQGAGGLSDGRMRGETYRVPMLLSRAARFASAGTGGTFDSAGARGRGFAKETPPHPGPLPRSTGGEGTEGGSLDQGVVAGAAVEGVEAGAAVEDVVAGAAQEGVVVGAADQHVVAIAAVFGELD